MGSPRQILRASCETDQSHARVQNREPQRSSESSLLERPAKGVVADLTVSCVAFAGDSTPHPRSRGHERIVEEKTPDLGARTPDRAGVAMNERVGR
jgi:hypothetical protein